MDFYELLDLLVTVPAQKVNPSSTRPPEPMHPIVASMDPGQKKSYDEAVKRFEEDQKEFTQLAADMCQTLDKLEDQEKKHNAFREAHAKAARKHFAKYGY